MKNKLNTYNRFTLKLCINAFSICVLSLMVLPTHAEEKTAAVEAAEAAADMKSAAMSAVAAALNVSNKPEVVVAGIPADVKAAVEKEILSKIEIEKSVMDNEALQVFRAPVYKVRPTLGYIAIVDGELLDLNKASSDARLSGYLKLIKDDFVLDSEEKASLLGNAFHKAYPYKFKKIVKPVKIKHGWIVPIGKFFKNYSGLVFTTNEKGKITLVEFSLSINPEDFSYKPIPE